MESSFSFSQTKRTIETMFKYLSNKQISEFFYLQPA